MRSINEKSTEVRITGVDLFCGVGGLTHGLVRGGIDVAAGFDLDSNCRYPFEENNSAKFFERDIAELDADEIRPFFKGEGISLLSGCAPCQPFSTYSRSGRNKHYESQWPLLLAFGRLIREVQPDLVTMENVPQVLGHNVFREFVEGLHGYSTWWSVVECSSIGVPQTRKRLVLLASRLGDKELSLNLQNGCKATVRKAIGSLPRIAAGGCDPIDNVHTASSLSELNLKRVRASKPGGTWRDWPVELQAACHRKASGATYPSVYGRMEWDKPAPTMTTQCFGFGNGRFGHPEQDRAISLREAAILQTFPADYRFIAPGTSATFNKLGRLIGNAVPVRLGEVVAQALKAHVRASV